MKEYINYILNYLKESYSDDALYLYYEKLDEKLYDIIKEFKNSKEGQTIKWVPMNISRLSKIWRDYSKFGVVRDERGIDDIIDNFVDKIITIDINTTLMGHSTIDPIDFLNDEGIEDITEEDLERMSDFLVDKNGQLIISDYGLNKLKDLAAKLLDSKPYEEKLLLLDQVLNVVHQRSDLASYFVQGGRVALDNLSNG